MKREINGQIFDSARQAYNALQPSVTLGIFSKRYLKGLSYEDLMLPPRGIRRLKSVTLGGKTYSSLRDAYSVLQPPVPYGTFVERHRKHWSLDKIMSPASPRAVEINGVIYESKRSAYRTLKPNYGYPLFVKLINTGLPIDGQHRQGKKTNV